MLRSIAHRIGRMRAAGRLAVLVPLAVGARTVAAQGTTGPLRLTRDEVLARRATPGTTPPGSSNSAAVQEIVIHGDPSKPGVYTVLLEVAPNTRIAAHRHPDDRIGTVISGDWYFGYGPAFDAAKLKRLPPGSVYAEPTNGDHFAMTRGSKVVVEITGHGPSGVTYVNPADDPSRRAPAAAGGAGRGSPR